MGKAITTMNAMPGIRPAIQERSPSRRAATRASSMDAARDLGGLDLLINNASELGPSPIHRMRFVNVRRAAGLEVAPEVHNDLVEEST